MHIRTEQNITHGYIKTTLQHSTYSSIAADCSYSGLFPAHQRPLAAASANYSSNHRERQFGLQHSVDLYGSAHFLLLYQRQLSQQQSSHFQDEQSLALTVPVSFSGQIQQQSDFYFPFSGSPTLFVQNSHDSASWNSLAPVADSYKQNGPFPDLLSQDQQRTCNKSKIYSI